MAHGPNGIVGFAEADRLLAPASCPAPHTMASHAWAKPGLTEVTETPTRRTAGPLRPVLLLLGFVLLLAGIPVGGVLVPLVQELSDPPNERPEIATALSRAVAAAGEVDIGTLAGFDWDRMYAFPAYTDDDRVSEVMGIPWGTGATVTRMPSDEFVLITFALGDEVTGWTMLNDYDSTGPHVFFEDALYEKRVGRGDVKFRVDDFTLVAP